jgi:hypothetical protein
MKTFLMLLLFLMFTLLAVTSGVFTSISTGGLKTPMHYATIAEAALLVAMLTLTALRTCARHTR